MLWSTRAMCKVIIWVCDTNYSPGMWNLEQQHFSILIGLTNWQCDATSLLLESLFSPLSRYWPLFHHSDCFCTHTDYHTQWHHTLYTQSPQKLQWELPANLSDFLLDPGEGVICQSHQWAVQDTFVILFGWNCGIVQDPSACFHTPVVFFQHECQSS